MTNLLRNFTHIVIPAEIWLRKDLSMQAKCLWAEIRSLHDKDAGGCFASDEYLMEFMNLKRSRLHEVFKELKDKNLMEASFNGRRAIRRAIVPEVEYQTGQQLSGKPDSSYPENRTPDIRDPGSSTYIYNKEDNKELYREDEPPKRAKISSSKDQKETKESKNANKENLFVPKNQKIAVKENVFLSESEIEKFSAEFGKQACLEMIEILSNYKHSSGKVYKSDYHTLIGWVKDRYLEKKTPTIPKGKLSLPGDGIVDSPDAAWRKKKL